MPNWVTNKMYVLTEENRITIPPEVKYLLDGNSVFDFNKVVPMPATLGITAGSMTHRAAVFWRDNPSKVYELLVEEDYERYEQFTREELFEGFVAIVNEKLYGTPTWYEWCVNNWGTKWNAVAARIYGDYAGNLCYSFQTAWSTPMPVFEQLSRMFPEYRFLVEFYDEDYGNNCGTFELQNGEIIMEDLPDTWEDGMKFLYDMGVIDDDDLEDLRESNPDLYDEILETRF